MADNSKSLANPKTESKARDQRPGVFVGGNKVTQAKDLTDADAQGSWGYAVNQGETRLSFRQDGGQVMHMGQDVGRIKTETQGSIQCNGPTYDHVEQADRL